MGNIASVDTASLICMQMTTNVPGLYTFTSTLKRISYIRSILCYAWCRRTANAVNAVPVTLYDAIVIDLYAPFAGEHLYTRSRKTPTTPVIRRQYAWPAGMCAVHDRTWIKTDDQWSNRCVLQIHVGGLSERVHSATNRHCLPVYRQSNRDGREAWSFR